MSLRVWLPLNGSLENKGTSNVTIVSGNPSYKAGKIGQQALNLKNRIIFDCSALANLQTFSICFWGMAETSSTLTTNWQDLLGFTDVSSGGSNGTFRWETTYGLSGSKGIHWHDNATNALVNGAHDHNQQKDIWVHCCVVFNNEEGKIYSYDNGILTQTHTHAGGHFNSTGRFYLGETNNIEGRITDVRIYDHALSAAEVKEISQGLVLHYKLDSQYSESTINLITSIGYCSRMTINNNQAYIDWSVNAGDTYIFFNTSEAMSTSNIYSFSFQCEGLSSSEENTISFGWANLGGNYRIFIHNGWNKLENFSPPSNELRTFFDDYNRNTTAKFKLYDFQLEKKDHATGFVGYGVSNVGIIQDSSGYGHNGSILNTITLSSDTPRYSASTNLTAGNSMINCGRGAMVTDSLTVNLWIKYSTWGNPISCTEGGGWNFENSSGIQFPVYIASVGYKVANAGTLPSANTWHMITGTYNRLEQTVNIYIDGELKKSTATGSSNLIGYHGSNVIWIGAEATGSNTTANNGMIGLVSDVRIYCTALSAADIKQLYEVGAKVDNKQNLHTFEIIETNSNLLAGKVWTNSYGNHSSLSYPFANFNNSGEYQFTANSTSAGSEYIRINPTGHTYEYDYTISVNAGNQFYIGFERYDINKTPRSNQACVYTTNIKPSSDIVKQRYTGTVNLSTDGTNPCAFIALRILNGWSGTTSGVTGIATIHNFSLREISTKHNPSITKKGQCIEEEIIEGYNMKLHKSGIVETTEIIEF